MGNEADYYKAGHDPARIGSHHEHHEVHMDHRPDPQHMDTRLSKAEQERGK